MVSNSTCDQLGLLGPLVVSSITNLVANSQAKVLKLRSHKAHVDKEQASNQHLKGTWVGMRESRFLETRGLDRHAGPIPIKSLLRKNARIRSMPVSGCTSPRSSVLLGNLNTVSTT